MFAGRSRASSARENLSVNWRVAARRHNHFSNMTPEALKRHAAHRRQRQAEICAEASLHKVCEQCLSISRITARHCFLCGAYSWLTSVEDVIRTAEVFGSSPFPFTAGTVPRLL